MSELICQQCGAQVKGYICEYCGSLTRLALDRTAEMEALNELHNIIVTQSNVEMKVKLLRHSFLPDTPDVLIEAGMRCIPLIDLGDTVDKVANSGAQRLRAITAKLRLLGDNGQTAKALREFEVVLAEFQEADRQFNRALVVVGLILLALLIVGCYWLMGLWV